jgi:hypothetical protein
MARRLGSLSSIVSALALGTVLIGCSSARSTAPPAEPHTGFAPLELELPGSPDWLGAAAGSMWVKRDDGVVTRFDPATGEVLADIDAKQVPNEDPCNGLGVTADAVWTCSDTAVVRIDPATNTITHRVPAGKIWAQGRLVEAADRIWVLSGSGDQLVGISTTDGTAGEPIALPARCVDLGAAEDILYAVCTDDDAVLRIDPVTGDATKVTVAAPNQVSATGSAVWVAAEEGLFRLDPTSLDSRLTVPDVVPGSAGGILADADGVWVRQADPFLVRVDGASGAQSRVISAPYGAGDVIAVGDQLWTSDYEEGVLLRLTVPAG